MKLSKWTIPYRAFQSVFSLIIIVSLSFSSIGEIGLWMVLAAVAVFVFILVAASVYFYLYWRNYSFIVEQGSIRIEKGVFTKQEREIPSRRIQNIDVKRNIIHRALGVAQVDLETAGGGDTEASLKYVDEDDIDVIRENLRTSEEAVQEEEERDYLYEMDEVELGILGLVSINLGVVALILGIFGISATAGAGAVDNGVAVAVVLGGIMVFTLIATFVTTVASTINKFYGFRLWEEDDKLRYERGLLNRAEGTTPLDKVQTYTIEENPVKRLLGFSTLKIETAGYAGEKAMEQGSEAAIPLATRREVEEFLEEFQGIRTPEIQGVTRRARRRYIGRYSIVLGAVLAITLTASRFTELTVLQALTPLVLTPLIPFAAQYKWKHRGYSLGNLFVSRNGFWNRKTVFTPYYRVQNLIESQTVLQRRWNLSSLTVDVAGSSFLGSNPMAVDLDSKSLSELRQKTYESFQKSLEER